MQSERKSSGWFTLIVPLVMSVLFFAGAALETPAQDSTATAEAKPKAILLGFDGVDYTMLNDFIQEGYLPNLEALRESGTISPLGTTNPAQSPVAWAAIVTGTNPGKTNIGGFIKRVIRGNMVLADLATAESSYQGEDHNLPFSRFSRFSQESKTMWLVILAAACFLVGLILLKALLRLGFGISLVGGIVLGGAAIFFGISFFSELPEEVPFPYNLQQGIPFWETLADNNIRTVGLYAPGAYPVVAKDGAEILGGLGNPDVTGSTGTWYVYSSEAFTFFDMDTNTGGKVIRLGEEGDGRLHARVFGPTNFFEIEKFKNQISALKKSREAEKLTASEQAKAEETLREKEDEYDAWRADSKKVTLDLWITPDYEQHSIKVDLEGQSQTVKEGDWSAWFKVDFKLSPFLKVPALVRLRLVKCADEEVRFFMPTIDISPEAPPDFIRLTSPADYATDLTRRSGLFETVGWACITHGLKDEEIGEEMFMEEIEFTMNLRNKLMNNELSRDDWDMFFEVFYSTDRVQHMMYRLYDEQHPQFNPQQAERTISFFGNNVKLKDSILESYKAMDRIVGDLMDRIEQGEFGAGTVLMAVSDHGFAPFYHCMGINNFLIEHGYQMIKPDASGQPQTVKSLLNSGREPTMLSHLDWEQSRAYSLGLGKIFVNLKGREPKGIVEPEDYDAVRDEIIRDLLAYVDPNTGEKVVMNVYKREEIFSGQFWKEGQTTFEFYDPDGDRFEESRYTEGFADLYLGFYPKYRVSWGTSLGGLEEEIIVPNEQKWSGDHVSVDPAAVPGVFMCNKKMRGTHVPSVIDIVPTLYNLFGVKIPEVVDGKPILLEK